MKSVFFLLVLMTSLLVQGQSPSKAGGPITTATGAFFALSVADIKASAQWYETKFGLKRVMEIPRKDKVAVVVLEGGGLIIELIENEDALPLSKATNSKLKETHMVHGIFKAGIIAGDFDTTVATIKERHIEVAYGPFPATASQRANVIVKDNSGNLIQFFGQYQAAK